MKYIRKRKSYIQAYKVTNGLCEFREEYEADFPKWLHKMIDSGLLSVVIYHNSYRIKTCTDKIIVPGTYILRYFENYGLMSEKEFESKYEPMKKGK